MSASPDDVFARAEALLAGGDTRTLVIAGTRVRLRFAAPRTAAVLDAAFAHVALPPSDDDGAEPHLTIYMIDATPTDAPAPDAAVALALDAREGDAWDDFGDGARVYCDFAHGRCLHWTPDAAAVPAWARASPLRSVLGRFLATRERFLAHAAAIGHASGAVLLAGKGGSGKSTSALACLVRGGMAIAGDDFVVIEPAATPRAHTLLATAKIGRAQLALFPTLAELAAPHDCDGPEGKAVLRLHPRVALAPSLPLRAVALSTLALDRAETTFAPASRAEAARALVPHSLALVAGAGAETFAALSALVTRLPAFRVAVGHDPRRIPAAFEALLATLGERAHA